MDYSNVFLVVMAGGSGTRLWPKSTSRNPKQVNFYGLPNKEGRRDSTNLLIETIAFFEGIIPASRTLVVTTDELKKPVLAACPIITALIEPVARDTAACLFWASKVIFQQNPDGIMIVMSSDHLIDDRASLLVSIDKSILEASEADQLVVLGIVPTRPEIGYGYMMLDSSSKENVSRGVTNFLEKPDLETAMKIIQAGNCLWNSGMYIWSARALLSAFGKILPQFEEAWQMSIGNIDHFYMNVSTLSISRGILERAENVVAVPTDCGWYDIGNWAALDDVAEVLNIKCGDNVTIGGQVISLDSVGNIIDVQGKLVGLLGVSNLVIVEYDDSILVAHKDRAHDVKALVTQIKKLRPEVV